MDLKKDLSDLETLTHPSQRGKAFETFLARMLEDSGFRVTFNAKSASPRQTDLMARHEQTFFIVEAKWTRKKSGIEDISSIRDRLSRVPPGVFACLFSMTGFSDGAIKDVAARRNQEIILFNGHEVRNIVSGRVGFQELLDEKRTRLRTDAIVALLDGPTPALDGLHLRKESDVFRIGSENTNWLRAGAKGHDLIFSSEPLNFVGRYGSLASLQLSLQIQEVADLERTLVFLKEMFDLSGQGSFAINQRSASWFGFGLENFLSAVKMQRSRYDDLNWDTYHHSEEIAYLDHLAGVGLLCLSSRQSVGRGNPLHSSEVEIYLPGVPVDMAKFRHLCRLTKNSDACIETIRENPIQSVGFRPGHLVEPVGLIVSNSSSDPWASGLVVKNPFLKSPLTARDEESEESIDELRNIIRENDVLICSLRSWHQPHSTTQDYKMCAIEGCWIGHRYAIEVSCDWM